MNDIIIRPYNVLDKSELPEVAVRQLPAEGDPIEIKGEIYFVCENSSQSGDGKEVIGVIPLVVRNPANISNIGSYLKCLSLAHRKVQYKNDKGICDFENCDEIEIT